MAVKKRMVVVGLGSIGQRHARLLNERKDVSVEIVEPSQNAREKAQKQIGDVKVHDSFEQMLETKPHAVLIATPHHLHANQTIKALEKKIPVLCEKPMSDKLSDALKMKEAALKTGTVLNIGFHNHFHPGLAELRKIILQGTLGAVLHAYVRVGSYVTLVNSVSRYQRTMEGALLMDYAHQPDMLYWLLGCKPVSTYAFAMQAGNLEFSSSPNIVDVFCEYSSSLKANIHLNYVQAPERHEYELVGDKGWAHLNAIAGTLVLGIRDGDSMHEQTGLQGEKDKMIRAEHQAFFDAVEGKRKPETSAQDGLVSMAIIEAAVKSYKTRLPVALDSINAKP